MWRGSCILCTVCFDAVWGCIRDTLPLTSPCSDTKRKTTVPLFFASTGGLRLLSFIPILHLSLQLIDVYSPSLSRFSQVSGSDYPNFRPILHKPLIFYCFKSLSLWQNLQPVAIRVFDEIDAHGFIFKANAAHLLVLFVRFLKVIRLKCQVEFALS